MPVLGNNFAVSATALISPTMDVVLIQLRVNPYSIPRHSLDEDDFRREEKARSFLIDMNLRLEKYVGEKFGSIHKVIESGFFFSEGHVSINNHGGVFFGTDRIGYLINGHSGLCFDTDKVYILT